jgi:hypothetical protein
MFAYLVILFEVVLLSFTFWYVFLRQPKPMDYSSFFPRGNDPWGLYERPARGKAKPHAH